MYERMKHLPKQSGYYYTPDRQDAVLASSAARLDDSMCPDRSSELSLAVLALVESSLLQVRKVDRVPSRSTRSARLSQALAHVTISISVYYHTSSPRSRIEVRGQAGLYKDTNSMYRWGCHDITPPLLRHHH